jgi:hypothetical protein
VHITSGSGAQIFKPGSVEVLDMKLHVILRTHDKLNVHNDWRTRYCDMSKSDLIQGCYKSLIRSILQVKDCAVHVTVLDDHSEPHTVEMLQQLGQQLPHFEFVAMTEPGYRHSGHEQWLRCRDSDADLVYSIEDDYLHVPSAVSEMIQSWSIFADKLNHRNIVLYPFDAPEEYDPPTRTDFIVHGSHRHWRTGVFSTQVLMTTPQLFKNHWPLFEVLSKNYNGDYIRKGKEHEFRYTEDNTIWNIWRNNQAVRFNPIPSLALHMQFDRQLDPFINWQQWWADYAQ